MCYGGFLQDKVSSITLAPLWLSRSKGRERMRVREKEREGSEDPDGQGSTVSSTVYEEKSIRI